MYESTSFRTVLEKIALMNNKDKQVQIIINPHDFPHKLVCFQCHPYYCLLTLWVGWLCALDSRFLQGKSTSKFMFVQLTSSKRRKSLSVLFTCTADLGLTLTDLVQLNRISIQMS